MEVVIIMTRFFTSESVTEGHPDKICDQVSDGVLDAILAEDKLARVACECAVNTGLLLIMGEITTSAYVDIPKIARGIIADIGYTGNNTGFDANSCGIITSIDDQSSDIALGVNNSKEEKEGGDVGGGAGDQGMMFGFASNETPEYMPLPISLAHKLTKQLAAVRKSGELDFLLPDGKSQVTVTYDGNKPVFTNTIIVSAQHIAEVSDKTLREGIAECVIKRAVPEALITKDTRFLINPTGRFVIGGPQGDSGLTGRKIIVDTYGGYARHGGGAFSGKDPTKVDRSAAYAARHLAKNIVAAGVCDKCEIEVAYAIGVATPVSISIFIDTFGTSRVSDEKIIEAIVANVDLRPAAIINRLGLRTPIYRQTAAYGHFGRDDLDLPWERLDIMEAFTDLK